MTTSSLITILGLFSCLLVPACDDATADSRPLDPRSLETTFGDVTVVATLEGDTVVTELYAADLRDVLFERELDLEPGDYADDRATTDPYQLMLVEAAALTYGQWEASEAVEDHLPPLLDCRTIVAYVCLDEICGDLGDSCIATAAPVCGQIADNACS